ncbi:hypothetical protein PybrP1_000043 [[Pythium] brassicae (nom. inval.)]|nr:hypothetical protein PybrP1_000043 [[Pythium] brassicae (nom. inval.)]
MEAEKLVLDDEEEDDEEEKEHFFADLAATSDRDDDDDDEAVGGGGDGIGEPLNPALAAPSGVVGAAVAGGGVGGVGATATGSTVAVGEQERRAQIGASPYLAPFTPLSSPSRPKTPSSVNISQQQQQQQQQRSASKKPQLVPIKNGPAFGASSSGGSVSRIPKDDVVQHLPVELVESLMSAVQTLDKLILGVEDYKPDQLGFLHEKVNSYVELLRQIDSAGANYHASIPLQVLEMIDGQENTNPELYTKAQLEKCQDESERAAGKVDTLRMLKEALESGGADL